MITILTTWEDSRRFLCKYSDLQAKIQTKTRQEDCDQGIKEITYYLATLPDNTCHTLDTGIQHFFYSNEVTKYFRNCIGEFVGRCFIDNKDCISKKYKGILEDGQLLIQFINGKRIRVSTSEWGYIGE